MTKSNSYILDFEIDNLTDSILNRISGDSFRTEISLATKADLKIITKSRGWSFDWKFEFNQPDREVYKLTIIDNPVIVQGLVSLTVKSDHVYMYLLESAPFNIGRNKLYEGVPGNLVAFACKLSFQRGGEGFVSFESKTNLIDHYVKTLGAYHFGGHLMVIDTMGLIKEPEGVDFVIQSKPLTEKQQKELSEFIAKRKLEIKKKAKKSTYTQQTV